MIPAGIHEVGGVRGTARGLEHEIGRREREGPTLRAHSVGIEVSRGRFVHSAWCRCRLFAIAVIRRGAGSFSLVAGCRVDRRLHEDGTRRRLHIARISVGLVFGGVLG